MRRVTITPPPAPGSRDELIFGAALTLLVFFWSRKIWGLAGAITSTIFCAFCPTMLAHSGLATSDLAAAFFLLASTGAYWRHLHDHRPQWWALSLATFGLACVAKYTAVLLLPIFGLLVLVRALSPQPLMLAGRSLLRRRAKWIGLIISLSTHGLAAMITIWAFCGFRYSAFNPALPAGDFSLPWDFVLSLGADQRSSLHFSATPICCPRAGSMAWPSCSNMPKPAALFSMGHTVFLAGSAFSPKPFSTKRPFRCW